jgi:SAM-dependent methyltransferase
MGRMMSAHYQDEVDLLEPALAPLFPEGLDGRTVLDFGCGVGLRLLKVRQLGAGLCLGIDDRAGMVEKARELLVARDPAPGDIQLHVGSFEDLRAMRLPHPFHVTLFFDLLERLSEPIEALRIAAAMTARVMVLSSATGEGAVPDERLPSSPEELAEMLRASGFIETRVVSHRTDGRGQQRLTMLASGVRGLLEPVARGKNGWLFLQQDTNSVLKQHSGEIRITEEDLERWQATLDSRVERLHRLGSRYFFFIAPNKESIYAEELPNGIPSAPERPVHQLIHRLERVGSSVPIIYPDQELIAAKSRWAVYSKGDTHWNGIGAFISYQKLIEAIEDVATVNCLRLDNLEFLDWRTTGDLSGKLTPPEDTAVILARPRVRRARLLEDNGVRTGGRVLVFGRSDLSPSKCLMFGDSFAWNLFGFLAESFQRFVFVHRSTVDYDIVRNESPDVVISESAERFLIQVPDDDAAPPTPKLVAIKRERGHVHSEEEMRAYADLFSSRPDKGTWNWTTDDAQLGNDLPPPGPSGN